MEGGKTVVFEHVKESLRENTAPPFEIHGFVSVYGNSTYCLSSIV